MKREITAALMSACVLLASAEGYQVNTLSAKQVGMGQVGVAMKLGAESQIFNPGALAFMGKTFEISGAVSPISATATATVDGRKYETSNKVSTPMNFSAAFRIYDNLYAGVTFYTPYGSSINWGKNWPGAVLNQSVDLKAYTVQPTLSWRILPNLSVGAGLMISWGSVNLNKGLVTGDDMDRLLELQYEAAKLQYTAGMLAGAGGEAPKPVDQKYGTMPPASVNLNGTTQLAFGVNVGALWDINRQWSVGASFRSKMNMKVNAGVATLEYANDLAESLLESSLGLLNAANFSAQMPLPYVFTAGVSYKPIERLTLAFDAQLNGWKAYKSLDIEFAGLEGYNQNLTKNYRNSMTYHIGGEFAMTGRLDLRAGLMIDCTPVNSDYYNPETPGTTRFDPSVGLSFRPLRGLSIDVAFMYVAGKSVSNAGVEYKNLLAPAFNKGLAEYNAAADKLNGVLSMMGSSYPAAQIADMKEMSRFTADYSIHAFIPSIGVSYSF